MSNEEKHLLLLKVLCKSLPYGVICKLSAKDGDADVSITEKLDLGGLEHFIAGTMDVLPYLRPMSSMTEEERKELKEICSIYIPTDSKNIGFEDYGILVFTHHLTDNSYSFKLNLNVIDWLNAHHFDYRGLIEKGLAIEVTEENNPYKE